MALPLKFEPHAEPHRDLMIWLGTYKVYTFGVRLGDNPTVRLDLDNQPQPDAVLLIDQACGGQSAIGQDLLPVEADGVIRSLVFPGLWLDVNAMLNHQMPQVLARLQASLESEPQRAVVPQLAQGLA